MAGSTTSKRSSATFDTDELLALTKWHLDKGDVEPALTNLKKILSKSSPPDEALTLGARLYAQLRLFDKSQDLFKRYLEANPDSEHESFQLGMTYFEAGDSEQALATWNKVLEKQSAHPPALFYKSLVLSQAGKTKEAREYINKLLQTAAPDNLYFGRAKDLLTALDKGSKSLQQEPAASDKTSAAMVKQAYETEH